MDEERVAYSVQRSYILTDVTRSEKRIITCDQRIDIPTIEPPMLLSAGTQGNGIIVPCIELAGDFLAEFDLTFETNESVTVLPRKIDPTINPYSKVRYVLVLPQGATGVKSCKLIHKATGKEVQHNFTFGIMSPPYYYDNALFSTMSMGIRSLGTEIDFVHDEYKNLENMVTNLESRVTALENKAGG